MEYVYQLQRKFSFIHHNTFIWLKENSLIRAFLVPHIHIVHQNKGFAYFNVLMTIIYVNHQSFYE